MVLPQTEATTMMAETTRKTVIAMALVALMLTTAGCSSILGGGDGSTPTPTPDGQETPTPTESEPPTPTASTPTPTEDGDESEGPLATKRKGYKNLSRGMINELNKLAPSDVWAWNYSVHPRNDTIHLYLDRPEPWSAKRTEMEAAREVVYGVASVATTNMTLVEETRAFPRPEKVRIFVRQPDGRLRVSYLTVHTDQAVEYYNGNVSIDAFAENLSASRYVTLSRGTHGDKDGTYYYKNAEWRPLLNETVQFDRTRDWESDSNGQIVEARIRYDKNDIYLEYDATGEENSSYVTTAKPPRSYLGGIRRVFAEGRTNRLPSHIRWRIEGDFGGYTGEVRSEYAVDLLRAIQTTNSTTDDITMEQYQLYYGRANESNFD